MYIRVKRKRTTIFLMVEPNDTILEVKSKLQPQAEKAITDMKLVRLSNGLEMEDAKHLTDLKIENDEVVALCFKKEHIEDGENEWEDVQVEEPPHAGSSS